MAPLYSGTLGVVWQPATITPHTSKKPHTVRNNLFITNSPRFTKWTVQRELPEAATQEVKL
jgi:hypothetical protein